MNPISLFPPPTSTISRNASRQHLQNNNSSSSGNNSRPSSSSAKNGGSNGIGAGGNGGGSAGNSTANLSRTTSGAAGGGGGGHGKNASSSSSSSTTAYNDGGALRPTKSGGSGGSGGDSGGESSGGTGGGGTTAKRFKDRLNEARLSLTPSHLRRANSQIVLTKMNPEAKKGTHQASENSIASSASASTIKVDTSGTGGSGSMQPPASNWDAIAAGSGGKESKWTPSQSEQTLIPPGTAAPSHERFPSASGATLTASPSSSPTGSPTVPASADAGALQLRAMPNASYAFTPPPSSRRHVSANSFTSAIGQQQYADGSNGYPGPRGSITSTSSSATDSSAVSALYAATSGLNSGKGAGSKRLPPGLFFDYLRAEEVKAAHTLEMEYYEYGDAATFEKLKYRQARAPHLFMGAFVPARFNVLTGAVLSPTLASAEAGAFTPSEDASEGGGEAGSASSSGFFVPTKMDSRTGSLSVGAAQNISSGASTSPGAPGDKKKDKRTLVGYICATAAGAYTVRAMNLHDESEDAHLVCIHSIVIGKIWRSRRVGKALVDTFLERIRDAELGRIATPKGAAGLAIRKRGYETAACIAHEELIPFFKACGFKELGHSHVQFGSGDWIELRKDILPPSMRKQTEQGWAEDDANKQAIQREEQRQFQAKKDADKKGQVEAYLQDTERSASPLQMEGSGSLSPDADNHQQQQKGGPSSHSPSFSSSHSHSDPGSPGLGVSSPTSSMSTSMLLNALRSQTLGASQANQRNPGQSFSAILGSALAGKTAHEDAFSALEARLVSRELGTNLGDVYCPREECGCKIICVDRGMWEVREIGPLSSSDLKLPNSPQPPMHPSPPQPPASAQVTNANGPAMPTTPGQAFWVVPTPLAFENISFSKDATWRPVPGALMTSPRAEGGRRSPSQMTKEERKEWDREQKEKVKEQKEAGKRHKAEQKATAKRERQNSVLLKNSHSPPRAVSPLRKSSNDEEAEERPPPPGFTVKYLLCAECDCGPLGYTILPEGLTGGGLAQQVGEDINDAQNGGGQRDSMRQEFLIAADRVRYKFPRT